jgi:hypothetical protein
MVDLVDRDSSDRARTGATIPPFAFVDNAERPRDRAGRAASR